MRQFLAVILIAFFLTPALAHLTPNSQLRFDIGPTHNLVDIVVPQGTPVGAASDGEEAVRKPRRRRAPRSFEGGDGGSAAPESEDA